MNYVDIPEKFNITTYLIDECNIKKGNSSRIAIKYEDSIYTYSDINTKVNKFSNYLRKLNIKKGDNIGILLYDSPEYIFLLLAAMKSGIVPMLINVNLTNEGIEELVATYKPSVLFTNSKLKGNINMGIKNEKVFDIYKELNLIEDMEAEFDAVETNKEDSAFLLFTSGSTSKPKCVIHGHYLAGILENFPREYLKIDKDDTMFSNSNFAHGLGLVCNFFYPCMCGASIGLMNGEKSTNIFEIIDALKKYKPTFLFSVPTICNSILQFVNDEDDYLDNLKLCVIGGENLFGDLYRRWMKRVKCDMVNVLSSTETVNPIIFNNRNAEKLPSIGLANKEYKVYLIGEDGNEVLEPNKIGELVIKSSAIMKGYIGSELLEYNNEGERILRTGDILYRDKDGYYWFVGRNKTMFKVSGKWVNAYEIELTIKNDTRIKETVVEGRVSSEDQTKIVAYIVKEDNCEINQEVIDNIKSLVRRKNGRMYCPYYFYLVDNIPIGVTNKLKRTNLHELKVIKIFK